MALDEEYALTIHEAGKDSVVYLRPLSDEEKRSQLWHMNDVRREPCVCLKLWGKRGGGYRTSGCLVYSLLGQRKVVFWWGGGRGGFAGFCDSLLCGRRCPIHFTSINIFVALCRMATFSTPPTRTGASRPSARARR